MSYEAQSKDYIGKDSDEGAALRRIDALAGEVDYLEKRVQKLTARVADLERENTELVEALTWAIQELPKGLGPRANEHNGYSTCERLLARLAEKEKSCT